MHSASSQETNISLGKLALLYHEALVDKLSAWLIPSRFMFEKIMPLSMAVSGYDLFDKMQVQKVIFKP